MPTTSIPLYGQGMHDFIIDEMELGKRVALCQDSEDCGWSALNDLQYEEWVKTNAND
jgi:hypothetical protein